MLLPSSYTRKPYLAWVLFFVLVNTTPALAQPSPIPLSPIEDEPYLMVSNWTTEDGLPSNYLNKVLQSSDKYIWTTCYSGLVRYDGYSFETFSQENTPGLKSNSLGEVVEAADSTLWITTAGGGLTSFKDGKFTAYGVEQGITRLFKAIHLDSKGRIWSGSPDTGWFSFKDGSFDIISSKIDLNTKRLSAISEDIDGNIWFGTESNYVYKYQDGKLKQYGRKEGIPGNSIWCLYSDSHQNLWIGANKGIAKLDPATGLFTPIPELDGLTVTSIEEDVHRNFWVATNKGLWVRQYGTNQFIEIKEARGDNNFIFDLAKDHEGNVWFVRLKGGLAQLKKGKFINYTVEDGLFHNVVNTMCEYEPNHYLLGFENGSIDQIIDGKISRFPLRTDLEGKRIKHIMKDRQNNLWISTYIGLLKVNANGTEKLYNMSLGFPSNLVRQTHEDENGQIWVATRDKGVILVESFEEGKYKVIDQQAGLQANLVLHVNSGTNGNILASTSGGGLSIISPSGEIIKVYDKEQGFISDVIFGTYIDRDNNTWVCSNRGLACITDAGDFKFFSEEHGLPSNNIYDLKEDEKGYFWIPSVVGVIKVKRSDLLSTSTDHEILFRLYDHADGLAQPECNPTSVSTQDHAGAIWFPTMNGISVLQPKNIYVSDLVPPVYVNHFFVDKDTILQGQNNLISPDAKRYKFHFSALYLYSPDKVEYKYRLDGFEEQWITSNSSRHEVSYTNLNPGDYTFQVIASNDEGKWNNEGDAISFKVQAHFYETIWFPIICVLILAGLTAGIYQARVNQLQRTQQQLEGLVAQRTKALKEHNTMLEQQREEIMSQHDEINKQHKQVLHQQREITSSIQYARRIQGAILPPLKGLSQAGLDGFIFFKPRDIVSGDFYWINPINNKIALAVADCTGHGVPGAFMSVLGMTLLEDIIKHDEMQQPKSILEELRYSVKKSLNQRSAVNYNKRSFLEQPHDGMDLSLCIIDLEAMTLDFAGAYNPLYLVRASKLPAPELERVKTIRQEVHTLYEILPDKQPIGIFLKEKPFRQQTLKLEKGDKLYLFTDGFYDQIGGDHGRKYMSRRFKKLILRLSDLDSKAQKQLLEDELFSWKGPNHKQIDDILIMGITI